MRLLFRPGQSFGCLPDRDNVSVLLPWNTYPTSVIASLSALESPPTKSTEQRGAKRKKEPSLTQKYTAGATVYVPTGLLPDGDSYPKTIYRTSVTQTRDRSAKVRLRDGNDSDWIATSKIHDNVGVAIISIGDFATEETLLNPLAKSVLQFCRLLLDDDSVAHVRVRAIGELGSWWRINHAAYSHVVLIGHGSPTSIKFGYGGDRTPDDFERRVFTEVSSDKVFISLSCETGKATFAKKFSRIETCGHLIAPFHSIHGAVASQFFQTFMSLQLLCGKSTKVAFNNASDTVPGTGIFRLWKDGKHN